MNVEEAREYFKEDRYAMSTTGIKIDEVGENYSKCHIDIENRHLAVGDHVMGGAIFTLADFTFAVATNDKEKVTLTLSSTINFVNQPKDKVLVSECRCIKDGRKTCVFETEIKDGNGRLVATVVNTGFHM